MRFTWARKKASPQVAVDRLHFVTLDFLKMLTLAMLCGLGISIAASILVVLISSAAEARAPSARPVATPSRQVEQAAPTPGSLRIGDGCDGVELSAVERDWYVRVLPPKVEVRVMQTFMLPEGEAVVAMFQVQLPQGAVLRNMSASTEQSEWQGKVMSVHAANALSPAGYRMLTRDKFLAIADEFGMITTSPLVDLRGDEVLIVQYTYVLSGNDMRRLILPLESEDDFPASELNTPNQNEWSPGRRHAASASVWVEWPDALPNQVSAPAGTAIDWSRAHVQGVSWSTTASHPGAKFVLSWSM
jgi:hypothetical protein